MALMLRLSPEWGSGSGETESCEVPLPCGAWPWGPQSQRFFPKNSIAEKAQKKYAKNRQVGTGFMP